MELSILLARYVNGTLATEHIPEAALKLLEKGYESPSLIILAGLLESDETERILTYFWATLREMNWSLPGKRPAALLVAKAILEEILSGKRPVFEGVQKLLDEALNHYPFDEENQRYLFDSIGFENAIGLFYSLDELPVKPAWPWQKEKPYSEQVAELEKELVQSLRSWRPRLEQEIEKSTD